MCSSELLLRMERAIHITIQVREIQIDEVLCTSFTLRACHSVRTLLKVDDAFSQPVHFPFSSAASSGETQAAQTGSDWWRKP